MLFHGLGDCLGPILGVMGHILRNAAPVSVSLQLALYNHTHLLRLVHLMASPLDSASLEDCCSQLVVNWLIEA